MPPMLKTIALLITLAAFGLSVAARGEAARGRTGAADRAQPDASPGLAILNRSCTSCHDAAQASQARPATDWQPIIERMRASGASLSDADARILLSYLVKNHSSP